MTGGEFGGLCQWIMSVKGMSGDISWPMLIVETSLCYSVSGLDRLD